MRPKKLIMHAFGPYAKTEAIDFEELGSRTMFVISGKTGAGKTTIFDAISFALYGKTSGEERSGQDLRSDFAEEANLTSVDFTFSLKNKTFRIFRSPIQTRKKTRGEGFTTVSAKAEIYEQIDGEDKLLGATLSESDDQINKLLQLDFHQFKQILMIPQGEFRQLLTSDSTDKEKILQKLFHTESYRYFQEYLKGRSKVLKDEATGYLKDRERYYQAIDPLDHHELTEALSQDLKNEQQILSLAKNLVATQSEKFNKLKKYIINQKESYKEILKKIENARYIEQAFNELHKTNEDLTNLKKKQQEIFFLKDQLQISKEAEVIWPLYQEVQTKEKESDKRKDYKAGTERQLAAAHQLYDQSKQELEELKKQKEEVRSDENKHNELNGLREKLEKYLKKSEQLNHYAESGKLEKNKLDLLKEQLSENEKIKANLSAAIQNRYDQQTRSADLKVELNQLNDFIKLFKEIEQKNAIKQQLTAELNENKKNLDEISQLLTKEQSLLEHALKEQSVQQAFDLSRELKEGEACPVCGSTHHPSPALREGKNIETEGFKRNIQSYQSEIIRTESAIEYVSQRIEEITGEIKNLDHTKKTSVYYKEMSSLNDYETVLKKLQQENQLLMNQLKTNNPALEMKQNDQRINELNQQIKELEHIVQQKRDEYISIRSLVNQLAEEIPESYMNKDDLLHEIKNLEKKIQDHHQLFEQVEARFLHTDKEVNRLSDRLKQADKEVKNTENSLEDARTSFQENLANSPFEDTDKLAQAKLNEAERTELEQKISSYEKKIYALKEYADKLEKDLKHLSKPDIKKLEEEQEFAESELLQSEEQHSVLAAYIKHHEQILRSLDENIAASDEVEKRYLLTGHLSEIANGQNELKLTFERFVLAYYLEDILLVANDRLLKMTSGRYELHRKEDRSKGNKQGGLELLVMDHYTGQQRHVKTLSGGEAFKASLALALGLADVVQSYAGGVSLETMFIDEGFGTLDPESLDQAIESLMDIQSSGRLVGVISHVPELKERIDARLEVFSTKGGSSTRFIFETL